MYKIRMEITNYLDWESPRRSTLTGEVPDDDDLLAESRDRVEVEKVWVLTIYKDDQFFPEVHRTFNGALDGAVNDISEHMEEDEVDDYDLAKIRKELKWQHYWRDAIKNVVYDIADCGVFA